jgi:hypothetical protein
MGSHVSAAANVMTAPVPVIRTSASAATDDRNRSGHDVERERLNASAPGRF